MNISQFFQVIKFAGTSERINKTLSQALFPDSLSLNNEWQHFTESKIHNGVHPIG